METAVSQISGSKKLKSSKKPIHSDRISSLPDSVLHHILSFLAFHYSVRTSVLSRRWRYLWNSLPTLNFNIELCLSSHSLLRKLPNGLRDFVDQVLLLRDNSDVQRFELLDGLQTITNYHRINSWILYALRRNVREISLTVSVDRLYRFPHCLFTSSSLTLLEMKHCCTPKNRLSLPNSISLPALKTLLLRGFEFEGYDVTNNFFSNCPLLESLTIRNCEMHHTHIIISMLKLKHLVIDNTDVSYENPSPVDGSLKLYAPNLIYFCCEDYFLINYFLENVSSLVKAKVHIDIDGQQLDLVGTEETSNPNLMKFLGDVQHVKALTLSASVIQAISGAYALLENSHTQFCNLRCLNIKTLLTRDCIHVIAYLLKISPNIETLSLINTSKYHDIYDEHLESACWDEIKLTSPSTEDNYLNSEPSLQCMLYRLQTVEIRGILGCVNELRLLEILLKNAMVLRKVVFFSSKESPGNDTTRKRRMMKFSERLLTFPTAVSRLYSKTEEKFSVRSLHDKLNGDQVQEFPFQKVWSSKSWL